MNKLQVGFQGVSGSFSEQALFQFFDKDNVQVIAVNQFEDIFKQLGKSFTYGVLPVENSSTGAVNQVYDLLNQYEGYIVGETCVKVEHNLLGVEGCSIDTIKEVYSHPQAFGQSKQFLDEFNKWRLIPYYNTAMSAKYIKECNDITKAAVASKTAASIYNLNIVESNINSNYTNTTRFIVVSNKFAISDESNKISVILSTEHKAGCLYNVLRHFAENEINMLKIESRPIKNKPWEYYFYIDFEGNINNKYIVDALDQMKKDSKYFKLLGNYKSFN